MSTSNETKDATTLEGTQSRKSRNPKDAKNSQLPGKLSNISNTETVSKMTLRRDNRQSAKAKEAENSSSKDSKSVKNKQISSACSDTSSDETDSESTSGDETCESGKLNNVKSGTFVQDSKNVKCNQTSSKPAVKTERKSLQEETLDTAKPKNVKSKKTSQDSKCAKDSQISSKSNVRTRQSSTEEKAQETENTGGQGKNSTRKEIKETQTKSEDAKKLKSHKPTEAKRASEKRQMESKKETEGDKSTAEKRKTRSQSKSHQEEKDDKNKPSRSSKPVAKDKVNQRKKDAQQEMSKSLRVYKEIYSSSDGDSSEEDEIADDKNQKGTDKLASETVKETSKRNEVKGKSCNKNKTPSSTTPSTTITAKINESKKGSLGSYRIPKRTSATGKGNDRKITTSEENKSLTTNSDKNCDASVKDVPQQSGSSTPKASDKLTSPLLTTTKVSPLHLTSTCQLSPGMMNLFPVTSHQQEPMKSVGFTTSSPVSTTTGGNKGEHSLSDLLSRCEEVFSNKSAEDKERTNQNSEEISDLERPPRDTRLQDPSVGHTNQGPQTTALPSVLTGLLAKTVQASSIPQNTRPSLPPALASLLPGGAVLKPTTPEPTSSNSLPQPLAKLMEPLASTAITGGKTTNSEPLTALPPELARLLPPGVRSVSPTPSQSMGVHNVQRDLPESASENADVQMDVPTKPTTIDRDQNSATQNQGEGTEKTTEVEPQQNVERKKSRPSRVQQSSSERKKPVVPEKRKVTYKGLSDEERLAAYINSGDRNNVEQRKSQRVDKQESNQRKKTSQRKREKFEAQRKTYENPETLRRLK